MRILIAGAGAVGGCYGAKLQLSGQDVSFLARGAHLSALRERGLSIRSEEGELHLQHVHADDHAPADSPAYFVLFCVKTYDNESAALAIADAVDDGTAICSLQNGVDNEAFLQERFPRAVVLGGTSRIEAFVHSPGVVVQRDVELDVTIGAFRLQDRPVAARIGTAFDAAGFPVTLAADIVGALWLKLLAICGLGGITAYAARPIGEVLRDRELARLFRAVMDEVAAVAARRGISLPPNLPELVFARARTTLNPRFLSSIARDVLAGRPLEVEALNGAVVRYGEDAGVPTPANRTILDRLLPLHRRALATPERRTDRRRSLRPERSVDHRS